jgi:hypothetical protein
MKRALVGIEFATFKKQVCVRLDQTGQHRGFEKLYVGFRLTVLQQHPRRKIVGITDVPDGFRIEDNMRV